MLIIRKFQPDDMFTVIKLASQTLTEQYNPSLFNYFYEIFQEGFIVAEKNHKIIGFIVGILVDDYTARILMLSVAKEHRRQKIATNLLNNMIEEFFKLRIKKIELEVKTSNIPAIKFYQKNGFKIIKKKKKFYQDEGDAFIMEYKYLTLK